MPSFQDARPHSEQFLVLSLPARSIKRRLTLPPYRKGIAVGRRKLAPSKIMHTVFGWASLHFFIQNIDAFAATPSLTW